MCKFVLILVLVTFFHLGHAVAQQAKSFEENRIVTVMTRNVYHGVDAEILAVPGAVDFFDLLFKVADVYNGYQTRNFPARAEALLKTYAITVSPAELPRAGRSAG